MAILSKARVVRPSSQGVQARPLRALVCLLPGLGDALVASPALRSLIDAGYQVDALTMLHAVTEYVGALSGITSVYELPLLERPLNSLGRLLQLRKKRYDLVVIPFPATRWQYACVAWLLKGRKTLIHRYGGASSFFARLARADEVELRGGHRTHENVRLLSQVLILEKIKYWVPDQWRREPLPRVLGIHSGTMQYKGNEARRWPLQNFVDVARAHASRGRLVRVFLGPNERSDMDFLRQSLDGVPLDFVCDSLPVAAQKVSECEVFLANDSGFAHLAAGLGVKTLTLFGMTDPLRATPLGPAKALRRSSCEPCHDEGLRSFACVKDLDYRCTRLDLDVDSVIEAVEIMFGSPVPDNEGATVSAFRLYAQPRSSHAN